MLPRESKKNTKCNFHFERCVCYLGLKKDVIVAVAGLFLTGLFFFDELDSLTLGLDEKGLGFFSSLTNSSFTAALLSGSSIAFLFFSAVDSSFTG